MSFADYLALTSADSVARARAVEYVEGFNAADSGVIGIAALARQQRAEDAIDSDRLFRVKGGYDALAQYLANQILAAGGAIVLGHIAQRIGWQRGAVQSTEFGTAVRLSKYRPIVRSSVSRWVCCRRAASRFRRHRRRF